MKKSILLGLFAMVVLLGFGQTTQNITPDFTAITMNQDTFNLTDFWQENPDKFVALEFFITETVLCQETSQFVSEAYQQFGCNDHDVVFLSINVGHDSASSQEYIENLNIQSQVVAGFLYSGTDTISNGDLIAADFGIQAYPTFILMGLDTLAGMDLIEDSLVENEDTTYWIYDIVHFEYNIVERDVWPIHNVETIVDTLLKYDIAKHDCEASGIFDPFEKSEYVFNLSPNPAHHQVRIQSSDSDGWVTYQIYDISGKSLMEDRIYAQNGQGIEVNVSALHKGVYFVRLFNEEKSATQKLIIQ